MKQLTQQPPITSLTELQPWFIQWVGKKICGRQSLNYSFVKFMAQCAVETPV